MRAVTVRLVSGLLIQLVRTTVIQDGLKVKCLKAGEKTCKDLESDFLSC